MLYLPYSDGGSLNLQHINGNVERLPGTVEPGTLQQGSRGNLLARSQHYNIFVLLPQFAMPTLYLMSFTVVPRLIQKMAPSVAASRRRKPPSRITGGSLFHPCQEPFEVWGPGSPPLLMVTGNCHAPSIRGRLITVRRSGDTILITNIARRPRF